MNLLVSTLAPLLFALAACGGAHADPAPASAGGAEPAGGATASAAENEHGARAELGERAAFGRTFGVVQFGDVRAGDEAAFELEFASGKERITTARGWIGVASGKGSMKSLWELEGETHLHGHVEVPATIPDGAMLWIDLEVDGATETVSIAYR
jgi:hypothetical protein